MMELANKKNVKVISLGVAAIFILGLFALGVTQSGIGGSSSSDLIMESAIGKVDYQDVMKNAPGTMVLWAQLKSFVSCHNYIS